MNIGFMGGTFSPPHKGHLISAKAFYDEAHLDLLIIIPAKVSPFKKDTLPTAEDSQRLEMCKICFEELKKDGYNVTVSDYELKREGTSYTVNTVLYLKEQYPDESLFMYVGSDMFLSLERWKSFKDIFRLCTIYTRNRDNLQNGNMTAAKAKYKALYGAEIIFSEQEYFTASSTEIREALQSKNRTNSQSLLTDGVFEYIIKNGLYSGEI